MAVLLALTAFTLRGLTDGPASTATLSGHTDWVWSVVWSPDGKRLATGSRGGPVWLWDTGTHAQFGQPLTGHTGAVVSVAWSPDGKTLATVNRDRTVRLWSVP